ncbi:MAG: hypothetical protein JW759_00625 [Candidatus Coatesbacteria bacterium]|nr:hypothetical protein [Candidatus Coatesbacteria bacterium]
MTGLAEAQEAKVWHAYGPCWGVQYCDGDCPQSIGYKLVHTLSGVALLNMNVPYPTCVIDQIEVTWYGYNRDKASKYVDYSRFPWAMVHTDSWGLKTGGVRQVDEPAIECGAGWRVASNKPGLERTWWDGINHAKSYAGPVDVKIKFMGAVAESAVKNVALQGWIINTIWGTETLGAGKYDGGSMKSWGVNIPFQMWRNPQTPTVWGPSPAPGSVGIGQLEPIHWQVIQEVDGIDPDTIGLKVNGSPVVISQVSPIAFGYECTYLPQFGWPSCATETVVVCASTASVNTVGSAESWTFVTAGCDQDESIGGPLGEPMAQDKSPSESASKPKPPEPQGPLAALASGFRWLFGADRGASHPSSDSATNANN